MEGYFQNIERKVHLLTVVPVLDLSVSSNNQSRRETSCERGDSVRNAGLSDSSSSSGSGTSSCAERRFQGVLPQQLGPSLLEKPSHRVSRSPNV